MFDHHDDVVDQQPDRRGDPAERHDVEAHSQHAEDKHRRRKRRGHDDDRDQRHPPAAQEPQQHQGGEHEPDQHRVAHARDRLRDELALVVPAHQFDAGRERERGELLLDGLRDPHRIAVGLFVDVEQHRGRAILDDALPDRDGTVLHRRDIAYADHALRIGGDDDRADLRCGRHAAIGDDERQAAAILHLSDRAQHIAGADRGGEVGHRQIVIGEPVRIGEYLHFGGVASLHPDTR